MRIILCRHGKTEWNLLGRKQGQKQDSPLAEEGRNTCRRIGEALGDTHIDAAYVSPLGRAVASAELILASRNIKQVKEPLLLEMNLGMLEGITLEELRKKAPEFFEAREEDYYNTPYPGGESYADLEARARKFLELLCKRHSPPETALVVTHEAIGRVIIGCVSGVERDSIPTIHIPNEAYYSLDTESRTVEWHNVGSGESGKGFLERKKTRK